MAQAYGEVEMGHHLARGAVAVVDERVAVEHVGFVFFGEHEHFFGTGVVVKACVRINSDGQHVDASPCKGFVEFEHFLVGGKAPARLDEHFCFGGVVVGNEEVFIGSFDKFFHFGKVKIVHVFVRDDGLALPLKQAHARSFK